ncbi:hypothetical protein [Fervidobacterium thailandense]|uniref:Uncharacterized protein n=1 Tax=Fervidobacterium thailandense TaxID=1008305 RepID=A0A1E3G2Z7_9BACT|nr:hypothetical protein [Fervidobacterium thailandense]ODN30589.1 hypothetical protein A4H02_04960 [Fervidobacterium thailandense]
MPKGEDFETGLKKFEVKTFFATFKMLVANFGRPRLVDLGHKIDFLIFRPFTFANRSKIFGDLPTEF